jgi:hypothetical protein
MIIVEKVESSSHPTRYYIKGAAGKVFAAFDSLAELQRWLREGKLPRKPRIKLPLSPARLESPRNPPV